VKPYSAVIRKRGGVGQAGFKTLRLEPKGLHRDPKKQSRGGGGWVGGWGGSQGGRGGPKLSE